MSIVFTYLLSSILFAQSRLPYSWNELLDRARSATDHSFEEITTSLDRSLAELPAECPYQFYREGLLGIKTIGETLVKAQDQFAVRESQGKFVTASLVLGLDKVIQSGTTPLCSESEINEFYRQGKVLDPYAKFGLDMMRQFESRLNLISSADVKLAVYQAMHKLFERWIGMSPRSEQYLFSLGYLKQATQSQRSVDSMRRAFKYAKKELRSIAGLQPTGRWEQKLVGGQVREVPSGRSLVLVCYIWNPNPKETPEHSGPCQHYRFHLRSGTTGLGQPITREQSPEELYEDVSSALQAQAKVYKKTKKPYRYWVSYPSSYQNMDRPFNVGPTLGGAATGIAVVAIPVKIKEASDPHFFKKNEGMIALSMFASMILFAFIFDRGIEALAEGGGGRWVETPISRSEYKRNVQRLKSRAKTLPKQIEMALQSPETIFDLPQDDFNAVLDAATLY